MSANGGRRLWEQLDGSMSQMGGMAARAAFGQGNSMGYGGQSGQTGGFIAPNLEYRTVCWRRAQLSGTGMNQRDLAGAGAQGLRGNSSRSMSPLGAGQMGQRQGGGMYGGGMNGAQMPGGQGQSNTPVVRTTLSLGFESPMANPQKLSCRWRRNWRTCPPSTGPPRPRLSFRDGRLILKGAVATEARSRLSGTGGPFRSRGGTGAETS